MTVRRAGRSMLRGGKGCVMGERVEHVAVYRDHARNGFSLFVSVMGDDGVLRLALLDGSRVDIEHGAFIDRVTATIEYRHAQYLMDQLWAAGVRPSGVDGGAGVVDAMRMHLASKDQHIADLRNFAMNMSIKMEGA